MDGAVVALAGALIGAGAVVAATLISGRRESRDERKKEVRLAAAEHAKVLGLASHSVEWLTWKAKFSPAEFSVDSLRLYNQEIHAALGALVGSLAVISALDLEMYKEFEPLTNKLYDLDQTVGQISVRYREQPQEVVADLASLFDRANEYHRELNQNVAGMFAVPPRGVRIREHGRRRG